MFLLTGCVNLKNIQELTYVLCIGVDYDEETDEYIVYLQAVNFLNVAKQEGGREPKEVPPWIAVERGQTINLAIEKLYQVSQPALFFGHQRTFLFSDTVIKKKMNEVMRDLGRNKSVRHTVYLYGTDQPIKDILNVQALFFYPPIYNILLYPVEVAGDTPLIKPIRLREFTSRYFEPVGGIGIPALTIDKKSWETGDKKYDTLKIKGGYFFRSKEFRGYLSRKDVTGLKWTNPSPNYNTMSIKEDGQAVITFRINAPSIKVKLNKKEGKPTFTLKGKADVEIMEKVKDLPYKKMKQMLDKELRNDIERTFEKGMEKKIDIYELGEKWFRYHLNDYQQYKKEYGNEFYLDRESITDIKMDVRIIHTNSYKYKYK